MTKRFSRAAALFFVLVVACIVSPAQSQVPPSGAAKTEPTYTLTYPGLLSYKLCVRVEPTANGGRTVFVQSPPRPAGSNTAPAFPTQFFVTDARLFVDAQGNAQTSRYAFGPTPDYGIVLEAALSGGTAYAVGEPIKRGSIPFNGRLIHPLTLQLFAGKLYDWNRGGAQTFAYFYAPRYESAPHIVTLTLTAPNGSKTEPIALADETVPARKLHASLVLPFMTTPAERTREIDLRIGPGGEVVQSDKNFFDTPFEVKSRAVWETPTRFILPFVRPGLSSLNRIILRADKLGTAQKPIWDIGLDWGEARSPRTFGHARCDANWSLVSSDTPWRGGRDSVCQAQVESGRVEWKADPGRPQITDTQGKPTWWFPSWFATSVWEGPGMPFADLVNEKRAGYYFPLWRGPVAEPFTLTRLPDTSAAVGSTIFPLRHYHFVAKDAYDVYTDGKWLIALLSSDKSTLIRDGWEAWAKTLPVPAPPTPEEKPAGTKTP